MALPRCVAITPPSPGPWLDALGDVRADALIVRLPGAPDAAEAVLDRAAAVGLPALLRPVRPGDVALAVDRGCGVHAPAAMDPAALRGRVRGWLSAACHDGAELLRAAAAGCDLVTLSPVFAPGSKPEDARPTLGWDGLAALAAPHPALRVLALGGVGPADLPAACAAGAWGVAGIGAFFG